MPPFAMRCAHSSFNLHMGLGQWGWTLSVQRGCKPLATSLPATHAEKYWDGLGWTLVRNLRQQFYTYLGVSLVTCNQAYFWTTRTGLFAFKLFLHIPHSSQYIPQVHVPSTASQQTSESGGGICCLEARKCPVGIDANACVMCIFCLPCQELSIQDDSTWGVGVVTYGTVNETTLGLSRKRRGSQVGL